VALPNRQSFFAVIVVKSSLQKPYSLFPVFLYVRLVNDKINRVDFVLKKKKRNFCLICLPRLTSILFRPMKKIVGLV
jgi:hypothetical protein